MLLLDIHCNRWISIYYFVLLFLLQSRIFTVAYFEITFGQDCLKGKRIFTAHKCDIKNA